MAVVCRVCVTPKTEFVHMFNLYYGNIPATKFVMDVFQIKIDSDRSILVMCNNCNTSLSNFYEFYNTVKQAQHKYDQMLEVPLKLEIEDDYSHNIKTEDVDTNYTNVDETRCAPPEVLGTNYRNVYDTICAPPKDVDTNYTNKNEPIRAPQDPLSRQINYIIVPTIKTANSKHTPQVGQNNVITSFVNQLVQTSLNWNKKSTNGKVKRVDGKTEFSDEKNNDNATNNDADASSSTLPSQNNKKQTARVQIYSSKKSSPRAIDATKVILEKYKLNDIVKDGKFLLKEEEIEEMIALFCEMKCGVCNNGIIWPNYTELEKHSVTVHQAPPKLTCCNVVKAVHSMRKHILTKHLKPIPTKVPCKVCNKLIVRMNYRIHLSRHLPAEKRRHQCPECNEGYYLACHLKDHIARSHSKQVFQCDMCSKSCKSKHRLRVHIKLVHTNTPLLCPECGKTIINPYNFEIHMQTHSGKQERVKCGKCDAVVTKLSLSSHMRTHRAEVKKCPMCPFETKRSLKPHIQRVHGEKTFACPICSMKFCLKREMRDHLASRHTGIPTHNCEFCSKSFNSNGNYYTHRNKMHRKQMDEKLLRKREGINIDDLPVSIPTDRGNITDERAGMLIDVLEKGRGRRYMLESLPTL